MGKRHDAHAGFQRADAIVTKVVRYYSYISVATVLVMGVIAAADVVTSKIFGFAIPITNDLVKYLMIPTCFCLLGEVQLSGGLMQVDLISRKYGKRVKKVMQIAASVLGMVIFGFAGWRISIQLMRYINSGEMSSMSSHAFPLWPFALVCAVSIFLLVFAFFWSALREFLLPPEPSDKT